MEAPIEDLVSLRGGSKREPGALRLRSADALERGMAFVEANGSDRDRLRAHVLLGAQASQDWVDAVMAGQEPDGSFAPTAARDFGLLGRELGDVLESDPGAATFGALAFLAQERSLHLPQVEAAVRFLESEQRLDGSFGAEAVGDERRLLLTGAIAGTLGRTRVVRPELLSRAGVYLNERWDPDRVEGARFGPLVAYSCYFSNAPHTSADAVLQWCGRALEKGFRSRGFDALGVLGILSICDVSMLPGARIGPEELLSGLLDEQARDGGFDELAPEGVPGRVVPTLEAMRALIDLCARLRPAAGD